MDVFLQKPKGQIKIWTIAGIIAICVYLVSYVFIDLFYFQAYSSELTIVDYIGFFTNFNGLLVASILVFLLGLFISKKRGFFVKVMLWVMMLTGFYFAMPSINNLLSFFVTYSGIELMYYVGLLLPAVLACVLLVSAILQKDSENKGATNMIAWLSIVVDVLLLIFQLIYTLSQSQNMGSFGSAIISLSGTISIVVLTCFSFIFLNATKAAASVAQQKEEAIDNLVEKIAKEPKAEASLEDLVEKVDRGDE